MKSQYTVVSRFDRLTTEPIWTEKPRKGATLAGRNEPNFVLFGSFGLEFLEDELLTGTSQDQDIDNFIAENGNKNITKKTQSDLNVFY